MAPSTSRSPLYDGCPPESLWNRVPHFQSSGPWASSSISSEPRQADPTADEAGQEEEEEEEEEADEWEYEETEDLIMLDLGSKSARLAHMSHEYTVTGLETDHPFFKLGNLTFKGRWDQLLGTELLLHLDRDPTKAKNEQTPSRSASFSSPPATCRSARRPSCVRSTPQTGPRPWRRGARHPLPLFPTRTFAGSGASAGCTRTTLGRRLAHRPRSRGRATRMRKDRGSQTMARRTAKRARGSPTAESSLRSGESQRRRGSR
ncbi:hypothetical protein FA10DRAFT_157419 [Acaromyces ingoldii]|uniref:Transcription factor TFIIIC triple barrel domain-containing protein n=1 Tax=Acaromyces ingoldii TaxID=215250 RepID=A0A316YH90_9BASI|nr:hypothetical protein FA10DRAFT_157419 [Acaromyces ingoldii]PWN88214.1 hypothetical protein FA10DRAFT_157419 [Acaromyces ingoldii]